MSKIVIKIIRPKNGKPLMIDVQAHGVPGGGCRAAAAPYLSNLPGNTVSDMPTEELYAPTTTTSSSDQVNA